MKQFSRSMFLAITSSSLLASLPASNAHAGPWLDALFGNRGPAYPVGTPVPVQSSGYGNYYGYYGNYGATPPSAGPIVPAGVPQAVPGYLPTAAYDTRWQQVPVTTYRPVTQFDPNYGTTVTSLQPCTTYQYQAARVPLIAPQPLLGEYGYRANRWPGINAPGYNPMGLGYAAPAAPYTYPTVQQIPNNGIPAPGGATGSSIPTNTLPMSTMNYGSYAVPSGTIPTAQPLASAYYSNPTNAPMTTVSPAATWQPSYTTLGSPTTLPNYPSTYNSIPYSGSSGVTVQPNVPNIPGAVSVTPLGPPTYSPAPTTPSSNATIPYSGANNPTTPNSGSPWNGSTVPGSIGTIPGSNGMVMPNSNPNGMVLPGSPDSNMILPSGVRSLNDPESTARPSFGTAQGNPQGTKDPFADTFKPNSMSIANIDSDKNSPALNEPAKKEPMPEVPRFNSNESNRLMAPPTLPANSVNPLKAPADFDSKPKWNQKLLDAKDRDRTNSNDGVPIKTVANRRNVSGDSQPMPSPSDNGIRFVPIQQPR